MQRAEQNDLHTSQRSKQALIMNPYRLSKTFILHQKWEQRVKESLNYFTERLKHG